MSENILNVRIQEKYDTEANWNSKNPILLKGEIAFSSDKNNIYKVGDGLTAWKNLSYAPSGTVTSVAVSNGGGLSVSGSPITSSGTITISHADTSSQASVNNSGRTYIQDITLDTYGHVTGIASATETVVNTDRYVNSAAFADATSADVNNPVKMTLTRAGSDTASVTAYIPKVSSSSAGVVPKGATVSSQSQTTKFLREDGTWAAPSYTTDTNTTYSLSASGESVVLSGSDSSSKSVSLSTLINGLSTGSSTPVDNDYYVSQYVNGGTTTTSYHRRPMSALWTYIKGKADSTYLPTTTKYAGSSSVSGAATSLAGFTNTTTTATAVDSATQNGHVYVSGTSDIYGISDGGCFVQAYSTSWVGQIYQDYRTGQIALRGKNNGTWQSWRKVLDSSNYTTYTPPVTNNAGFHNSIYRGKSLGTSITTAQWNSISAGTFDDMYIGDYWTLSTTIGSTTSNIQYVIAGFDYWWNCGDSYPQSSNKHHVVLVPAGNLYSAQMNATNITTGGYIGSAMYTTNLANARTGISTLFGDHLYSVRRLFTNSVNTVGQATGWALETSSVDLMSETMVYGHPVWTTSGFEVGVDRTILPLFALNPASASIRSFWWLRSVAAPSGFAGVSYVGFADYDYASASRGVRPAFAIY